MNKTFSQTDLYYNYSYRLYKMNIQIKEVDICGDMNNI